MVKDNGYWVPVVFGWLPDKSETSYKVFFYMIEKKLEEMGLELKVRSVLCDFELNIMKSIDMMLQVPIMGCFFHHKKCFQRRVEKKGFKTRFENDEKFNKFIAEISSISFLPISDVQDGLKHVDSKFTFDDEKAQKFKDDFIEYVQKFWIDGPIPVRIWNVFGRSEDTTNNAQEGYNSKFNKELNVTHPSPGVLLCHIRSQIVLSEDKFVRILGGLKKPAQRKTYKELAKRRLVMKKQYLKNKEMGDINALEKFLSNMGHNVKTAAQTGRVTDYQETRGQEAYEVHDDPDVSNWIPVDENSILEDLPNDDVYEYRKVGQKKPAEWRKEKCVSCKIGFNNRSNPVKCDGCDKYTHKKTSCLKETHDRSRFLCKLCAPSNAQEQSQPTQEQGSQITRVANGFKCNTCSLTVKTKYSIERHVIRMHGDIDFVQETTTILNNTKEPKKKNLVDILKTANLMQYNELFIKENIDLDILKGLNDDEYMDMFREIGISTWGHRHQLKKAVQCSIKETVNKATDEHQVELGETVDESNEIEQDEDQNDVSAQEIDDYSNDIEVEEAQFIIEDDPIDCAVCNSTTQHVCSLCGKKVCQIFCSEQDQNSTNEYHRKHKDNDPRCTPMKFNCPFCDEEFVNKNNFDDHMNNHNENSYEEMTQLSNSEDSLWKYSSCKLCGEKFGNELDVKEHMDNWHGRIKQNLRGIDLEEESEDEYIPSDNDDVQENDNFLTRKQKRIEKPEVNSKKKSKTEFRCERCESTFSRKEN